MVERAWTVPRKTLNYARLSSPPPIRSARSGDRDKITRARLVILSRCLLLSASTWPDRADALVAVCFLPSCFLDPAIHFVNEVLITHLNLAETNRLIEKSRLLLPSRKIRPLTYEFTQLKLSELNDPFAMEDFDIVRNT